MIKLPLRKTSLILISAFGILALNFIEPSLRTVPVMQIFFKEVGINIILAVALSIVFIAGYIEFSLGGVFLLGLALVRLWRKTDWALEGGYFLQVSVAALIPLVMALLGAFVGWVISLRRDQSVYISLSFALLFGAVGFSMMPEFGPWCEPWFCAELLLRPNWLIVLAIVFGILVSAGTIYYFAPDFHWIRPVSLTWLMLGLGSFVIYEYEGLPLVLPIAILSMVAFESFLNQTRMGLSFRAVGSNSDAARRSGISLSKTSVFAFAILGFLAGLAALFEVDLVSEGDLASVYYRQLDAFIAVMIGGVGIHGGRGSLLSVALAALFITTLNQLEWLGLSNSILLAIKAVILLGVLLLELPLARLFKWKTID